MRSLHGWGRAAGSNTFGCSTRQNIATVIQPSGARYTLIPNPMHEKQTLVRHLNWVRTETSHPETVLLIHAVGQDLTYWDRQIEALADCYNVVALDLSGTGG